MSRRARGRALAAVALLAVPRAAPGNAPPLAAAAIAERPGAQLPLATPLRDAQGRAATLGELLAGRPALLVFSYYHCPMLCGLLLEGLARGLAALQQSAPADLGPYAALALSIDPRDDAASASQRQQPLLAQLGWPAARWPFATGTEADVRALAERAGFGYRRDPVSGEYAHAAAALVLAPGGRISSYLYGVEFAPEELAAALREAQAGGVRSPLQRMLLRCFRYVPALRRYAEPIAWFLRLAALATLAALGLWFVRLCRAERKSAP